MKPCPEKASGPWPCYEITFDELVVVMASQGVGTERDGVTVEPTIEAVDSVLAALTE